MLQFSRGLLQAHTHAPEEGPYGAETSVEFVHGV